jgi:hypothetical protein
VTLTDRVIQPGLRSCVRCVGPRGGLVFVSSSPCWLVQQEPSFWVRASRSDTCAAHGRESAYFGHLTAHGFQWAALDTTHDVCVSPVGLSNRKGSKPRCHSPRTAPPTSSNQSITSDTAEPAGPRAERKMRFGHVVMMRELSVSMTQTRCDGPVEPFVPAGQADRGRGRRQWRCC